MEEYVTEGYVLLRYLGQFNVDIAPCLTEEGVARRYAVVLI